MRRQEVSESSERVIGDSQSVVSVYDIVCSNQRSFGIFWKLGLPARQSRVLPSIRDVAKSLIGDSSSNEGK